MRKLAIVAALGAAAAGAVYVGRKVKAFLDERRAMPLPDNGDGVQPTPSPSPSPSPQPKPDEGEGGGADEPQPKGVLKGNPPRISAGEYNEQMFPNATAVQQGFQAMLYIPAPDPKGLPKGTAKKFQKDWNAFIKAIAAGKIQQPNKNFRGLLVEDDVPGVNTLAAMEIIAVAHKNGQLQPYWKEAVMQAKA